MSLFFISIFLFPSCSSELSREEFIQWVEDYQNGFHVEKTTEEFVFDIQYQPAQYLQLQQNVNTAVSLKDDGLEHFTLVIRTRDPKSNLIDFGATDFSVRQQRLYYFSYQFQSDIYIEQKGKKYPCVLFHFERQDDLSNSRTFVMAFESPDASSTETFVTINSGHFGSLPIRIKILKNDIPALKDEHV